MLSTTKSPAGQQAARVKHFTVPQLVTTVLREESRNEVFRFLAETPNGGFFLRGHIQDNGLVSSSNRGQFVGVRNSLGELDAVALIGHATLFEARSEAGLAALARVARAHHTVHMVLGDQDNVESFWHYYSPDQSASFASCRELMFQLKRPALVAADSSLLRLARAEDMEALLPVHAEMAFRESGINPLEKDPHGFRQRYLRRIEKDRVWVAIEDGRLLFKTDVALHTSDTVYLEGVHVNPEMRGTGLGCGLLTQVTDTLLKEARSVCLLVNEENILAQRLYLKAGFEFQGYYKTIFVRPGALN